MEYIVKHVELYAHDISYRIMDCDDPEYVLGVPDEDYICDQLSQNKRRGTLESGGWNEETGEEFVCNVEWWITE